MMAIDTPNALSELERQRQANIAEQKALLKELQLTQPTGKFTTAGKTTKRATPKRMKEEDSPAPRRQSSRLQGLAADSELAKRKAEEQYEAAKEVERVKKIRRTDSFTQNDMFISGQKLSGDSLIGIDVVNKGVAEPYLRTFGDEDIQNTTDRELKALREEMNGLQLWDKWDPQSTLFLADNTNRYMNSNSHAMRNIQGSRSPPSGFTPWHSTPLKQNLWSSLVIRWDILAF
jgi:hypothetical protein